MNYGNFIDDSLRIIEKIKEIKSNLAENDYSSSFWRNDDEEQLEAYQEQLGELRPAHERDSLQLLEQIDEVNKTISNIDERYQLQLEYFDMEDIINGYENSKVDIAKFVISSQSMLNIFSSIIKSFSGEGVEGAIKKLSDQYKIYMVSTITMWLLWLASVASLIFNVKSLKS